MFCIKCGAKNLETAVFCYKCGGEMNNPGEGPPGADPRPRAPEGAPRPRPADDPRPKARPEPPRGRHDEDARLKTAALAAGAPVRPSPEPKAPVPGPPPPPAPHFHRPPPAQRQMAEADLFAIPETPAPWQPPYAAGTPSDVLESGACHKCGGMNPESAVFCNKCGAGLKEIEYREQPPARRPKPGEPPPFEPPAFEPQAAYDESSFYCVQCGNQNIYGATFCMECGQPLGGAPARQAPAPPAAAGRERIPAVGGRPPAPPPRQEKPEKSDSVFGFVFGGIIFALLVSAAVFVFVYWRPWEHEEDDRPPSHAENGGPGAEDGGRTQIGAPREHGDLRLVFEHYEFLEMVEDGLAPGVHLLPEPGMVFLRVAYTVENSGAAPLVFLPGSSRMVFGGARFEPHWRTSPPVALPPGAPPEAAWAYFEMPAAAAAPSGGLLVNEILGEGGEPIIEQSIRLPADGEGPPETAGGPEPDEPEPDGPEPDSPEPDEPEPEWVPLTSGNVTVNIPAGWGFWLDDEPFDLVFEDPEFVIGTGFVWTLGEAEAAEFAERFEADASSWNYFIFDNNVRGRMYVFDDCLVWEQGFTFMEFSFADEAAGLEEHFDFALIIGSSLAVRWN